MGTRRLTSWRKVVALAPLLMLVVSLPGQMLLRCRMDGLARASCCRPASGHARQPTGPAWKQQSCCDRPVANGARALPIAEPARAPQADHLPVAIVLPRVATALASPAARPPHQLRGHDPPRAGPRIVVLKQAFLI